MFLRCRPLLLTFAWGALGCGSRSGLLVESTEADAGVDAALEAGPDAGDPELAACNHAYDALYLRCGGPVLPPNTAVGARANFLGNCETQIALPGSGMTTAGVEACASALDRSPCEPPGFRPAECSFRGSLQTSAPCNENFQCASAVCQGTVAGGPPGFGPPQCGTCAREVAVGAACMTVGDCIPEADGAGCPIGAQCLTTNCVDVTYGDVGAPCDDVTSLCATGLYCAEQAGQCATLAAAGETCGIAPHSPGGCAPPLACIYGKCGISGVDEPCGYDLDCAPGLACDAFACEPVDLGDASAPCNGSGGDGLCPAGTSCVYFSDGGSVCGGASNSGPESLPCSPCDIFSVEFSSGECEPHDGVVCR